MPTLEVHAIDFQQRLTRGEWQELRRRYEEQVDAILKPIGYHQEQRQSHPVYDFLFTYYSFRPARLRKWSPGLDVYLEGADDLSAPGLDAHDGGGYWISPESFPEKRVQALHWVIRLLEATQGRKPHWGCYGWHEWAMVYRSPKPRHEVPLRFPAAEIERIVEAHALCCTHYDAFRFFTKAAEPRNRHMLSHENRTTYEQPGCIHAQMDLYKWAYKFYPWLDSGMLLSAFELAIKARVLDMQASPYDLKAWGFEPIAIETAQGKRQYETRQHQLFEAGVPIREALSSKLKVLLKRVTPAGCS